MIYYADKYKTDIPNVNQELSKLVGELPDKEAKISLAQFLYCNLGLTTELISGIQLAAFQEIVLKTWFNRNFNLFVAGRGGSKSTLAAIFCFLKCIFFPGSKILIAGPTFRTARHIFNQLEKFIESREAQLLSQCFNQELKTRRNDQFNWRVNDGEITAIPLNGEKIRGFRATDLVLDEFLLLPKEIIENVLMPFLVAPQDITERMKIRELEDALIAQGLLHESDREVFKNTSKMIALSSASYTFENLYTVYKDWISKICSKDEQGASATYFVAQLSYEAIPPEMVDTHIIEEAQSGGASLSSFQREYCARFTDGSDSYFSAKKMHECTFPDGSDTTLLLKGELGKDYILAIDPSFSNSPSSDDFAMCVLEVDYATKTALVVHNYAVAGADLKEHINYFCYLQECFSIALIIIDNAGFQFIDSANECDYLSKRNIKYSFFDLDTGLQDVEYSRALEEAKRKINRENHVICVKQHFGLGDFIRRGNEHLQACIDHKRIWFGAKINANGVIYDKYVHSNVPLQLTGQTLMSDLIDTQDELIVLVKKECALIEVSSNIRGNQNFDLPVALKKSTASNRARRDSYTALLLGCWGTKILFDLANQIEVKIDATFTPILI